MADAADDSTNVEPRQNTLITEEAAADAANANQDASEQLQKIAEEEPGFGKLVSMLNCLKPHCHARGTRKNAMQMLENMSRERVVEILQQMRRVEATAVAATEAAQDEATPSWKSKSAKQMKDEIKSIKPDIRYEDLRREVAKMLKKQRNEKSKNEKKIDRANDKAKSRMRNTDDDEVIVELLHNRDNMFLKHLNQMSNANIALKIYIEEKKIAMGMGRKTNFVDGIKDETPEQARGRIHRTLESKFTTESGLRSAGHRQSNQSHQSRADRPTKPGVGSRMPGNGDTRPGWMRNLGL